MHLEKEYKAKVVYSTGWGWVPGKVSMAFVLDTQEYINGTNEETYALDLAVLEADVFPQEPLQKPTLHGQEMNISILRIEPIFKDAIRAAVICRCGELTLVGCAIYFQIDKPKESIPHRYIETGLRRVDSWKLADACNLADALYAHSFHNIWSCPIEIKGRICRPKFIQIRDVIYLSKTIDTTLQEICLCTQWASCKYFTMGKSYKHLAQEYYESCPKRIGTKGAIRVFEDKLVVKASEHGYTIRDYEFR